jgi:hypothetical protein
MKSFLTACMALLLSASPVRSGEIQELHRELVGDRESDPEQAREIDEIFSTEHGISEIGLERTPCFGKCPVYVVFLKADGTFRFEGFENVRHRGRFTGKTDEQAFHDLAQFIVDCDYLNMEDTYEALVTDHPDVYTTVVRNGERKVIRNYANAGPTKLWAIEQLIDKVMLQAKWND